MAIFSPRLSGLPGDPDYRVPDYRGANVVGEAYRLLGKAIPIQVEAPRFHDSRHIKVVRLSALRTGRLYPPGNITGTRLC
jgi:hypothetical protein